MSNMTHFMLSGSLNPHSVNHFWKIENIEGQCRKFDRELGIGECHGHVFGKILSLITYVFGAVCIFCVFSVVVSSGFDFVYQY